MAITVVGTAQTINSATVALPSGIQAHDTIIIATGNAPTFAGFTEIADTTNPHIYYKMDASGSEGTSIAASLSVRAANVIVLRGVDVSVPVEAVTRTTTLDPPSITPSWGSAAASAFMAFAYGANQTSGIAISTWPTSYTDSQSTAAGIYSGTTAAFLAIALRLATLASDDPSAFTINQGAGGTVNARTIAVKAAGAVPLSSSNFLLMFN